MPTVALDAVGTTGAAGAHSTGGASWSHTIGGSATALVVGIGSFFNGSTGNSSLTTHTVKVGTTPLTQLGIINCGNANGNGWTELWGLINPPTGAQTITVVENVSASACFLYGNSVSYTGVGHFGTPVLNSGSGTNPTSGAIVSAVGSMVVSVQGIYDDTLSSPTGTSRYNQPASPNASDVTLLIEDKTGAATVTQRSTPSNFNAWGVVSVNLAAGTPWTGNSSLALTVTRTATASHTGGVWFANASLALTATATAAGVDTKLGPPLRYVGRYPDSPAVIVPASYAQTAYNATAVSLPWVDGQVATAAANLVNQAYVNQQIANYTTQAQVTAALANYVPNSALGAASGVAQINASSQIPTAQLPALVTNSLAVNYDAVTQGTVYLASATTHTVSTQNLGEFPIAAVTVTDPGYPYVVWPFAYVLGSSGGVVSGSRLAGNGNSGFLAVTPPGSNTIYAAGVMTDDPLPNYYAATPYGSAIGIPMTPITQPPINGSLTLQLSACCWAGSSYIVSGTGLNFYILVLPSVGT